MKRRAGDSRKAAIAAPLRGEAKDAGGQPGAALQSAAFVVLLICLAVRPFLNETNYRMPAITAAFGVLPTAAPKDSPSEPADRMELACATFALGIFAAAGLFLAGGGRIGRRWLISGVAAFAVLALATALAASK